MVSLYPTTFFLFSSSLFSKPALFLCAFNVPPTSQIAHTTLTSIFWQRFDVVINQLEYITIEFTS